MRIVTIDRTRYEFVRAGCATDLGDACQWHGHGITVIELRHGSNRRRWNLTQCVDGRDVTADVEVHPFALEVQR